MQEWESPYPWDGNGKYFFPRGDPHWIPMGILWGFPQELYGMGIEISFPRQPCL